MSQKNSSSVFCYVCDMDFVKAWHPQKSRRHYHMNGEKGREIIISTSSGIIHYILIMFARYQKCQPFLINGHTLFKFVTFIFELKIKESLCEHYFGNFGNLERPVHFLKVLVKDIWKTGFRSSLSQKLKICQPF